MIKGNEWHGSGVIGCSLLVCRCRGEGGEGGREGGMERENEEGRKRRYHTDQELSRSPRRKVASQGVRGKRGINTDCLDENMRGGGGGGGGGG